MKPKRTRTRARSGAIPGWVPPNYKLRFLWIRALVLARKGKPDDLMFMLRSDPGPVPQMVREGIAGMLATQRGRGVRSRLLLVDQERIRDLYDNFVRFGALNDKNRKMTKAEIRKLIAEEFTVSEATIRDVLAERGAFAEK